MDLPSRPFPNSSIPAMWNVVLPPLVLVIVFWAATSIATNFYLQWIEDKYQRVVSENLMAMEAANEVHVIAWQLLATDSSRASPIDDSIVREQRACFHNALERLSQIAHHNDEFMAIDMLRKQIKNWESYVDSNALDHAHLLEIINSVTSAANEILKLHRQLLQHSNVQRRTTQDRLLFARLAALVVGPLIGIYFGWRLTQYLQQRVAVLAITLHAGTATGGFEVADVSIPNGADLQQVQLLAESIRERISCLDRELESARREILQSERLAAIGELAAGVAHELRNPMTSVKLLLQDAVRHIPGKPLSREKAELILSEVARMESTIQGLLEFSKPPRAFRVRQDFRHGIERALNLVEGQMKQQEIAWSTDLGSAPVWVDADGDQLHQVVVNLLINSIEAMPNGGQLQLTLTARPSEHRLRFTVHDTGSGITEAMLLKMFEPYATTKLRGTGLGLAISRQIIEQHAGTIRAENHPAGGAAFYLELPLAVEQVTAVSTAG